MTVFGEALRSLVGAGVAMSGTCILASAIPLTAAWTEWPSEEEWLVLAVGWIWHWVLAGLMFWGIVLLAIPAWCLSELLHGTRNPFLLLGIAFVTQLLVSTVGTCITCDYGEWQRPAIASSVALAAILVGGIALRHCRR